MAKEVSDAATRVPASPAAEMVLSIARSHMEMTRAGIEAGKRFGEATIADLVKALRELLEATDIEPRDLPTHEYEEILCEARSRARKALAKVEGR